MKKREKYRIVFFGTPEFAVSSLDAMRTAGYDVCAVVTAADKKAGRGQKMHASDVKKYALQHTLHILQPKNLKSEKFLAQMRALEADLYVVVAFRMMPRSLWSIPPDGTINIHGSLLPKFRGAAPIHWAVIRGETHTGVTAFRINEVIDTGAILHQKDCPIDARDTTGDVYARLQILGAEALIETLDMLREGKAVARPQDESLASDAPKIYTEDSRIDFQMSAKQVYDFIRGMSPYPCAWTTLNSKVLKIYFADYENMKHDKTPGSVELEEGVLKIYTSDGAILPQDLQLQNKKRMPIRDFVPGLLNMKDRLQID